MPWEAICGIRNTAHAWQGTQAAKPLFASILEQVRSYVNIKLAVATALEPDNLGWIAMAFTAVASA
jgi:hypothetical protein